MGIIPTIDGSDMVVREGLIGRWMGGVGGTPALGTVLDFSGRGTHGTLFGDAFVNRDGFQLDGDGDRVDFINNGALSIGTLDYTVSAWIKTSYKTDYAAILNAHLFGEVWQPIYMQQTTGLMRMQLGHVFGSPVGGSDIADGILKHVAISVDRASDATFFIDGAQDGGPLDVSASCDIDIIPSKLFFGFFYNRPSRSYNGSIDDVRIYNRALSAAEVRAIYDNTKWRHQ